MLKVKCYSDYKANQRPISFTINNREFPIKEIVDQWYSPGCLYFKVRDKDNHIYILKYDQEKDLWELEFFRKEKK
ncbi:MAG: hypothetical protein OEY92_02205 [Elusimicrobiota bacterium]|nr:hypothetical protein [Elusimicrobiota bacterium]